MSEQISAKEAKALRRRNAYIRAVVIMFAIALIVGVVSAFIPAPTQLLLWVIAYVAGFVGMMTLLYAFWHQIIALPGSKEFNDKVASGEIIPTEPPVKKRKRGQSDSAAE